ncbi:MAG TPA: class II aldolase/adducin family protein, partial [Terriglobales bacterium]|nr:class II aldolase/adducin family protein [Terriglobales bacterium]
MRDERARHAAARRALVRVSRYAGARADLVQAGGGNTSVKTPDGIMYTKASGIALDRVTTRTGAAAVRLDGVRGADGPTAATLARWQAACAVGPVRPSIEVALHAVLDTVVLHTHPVAINAFVCARRGIAHARRLLRPWAPLVIPYRLPGIALAALLARALAGAPAPRAGARVVLLASHGLVVSGPSVAAVIDTNEAVVRTLADAVGRPAPAPPPMDRGALGKIVAAVRAAQPGLPYVAVAPALPAPPRAASTPAVLFPDAAVYCGATALPLPDGARPAALRAAAARYAR